MVVVKLRVVQPLADSCAAAGCLQAAVQRDAATTAALAWYISISCVPCVEYIEL